MIVRFLGFVALAYLLGFVVFMLSLGSPLPAARVTDAIVVPTGGPGRIDRGIALIEAKAAKRMLVSGVAPTVRPIELAVTYSTPPALFACCIDLGQQAFDTRSNGDETALWVSERGYRSVRLVTSDWHMARARLELTNALGPDVEVIADPVPTNARLATLVSEYSKLIVRRIALLFGYNA